MDIGFAIIGIFVLIICILMQRHSQADDGGISRSDYNITKGIPEFRGYKNYAHSRHRRLRKRRYRGKPVMQDSNASDSAASETSAQLSPPE